MRIALWGIGAFGTHFKRYCDISNDYEVVVAFDSRITREKEWESIVAAPLQEIDNYEFDKIVITPKNEKVIEEIEKQLNELEINPEKIIVLRTSEQLMKNMLSISQYKPCDARVSWLRDFSRLVNENIKEGAVAECGVNRGDFSMYINEYFHDRKLYLFDTFHGFDERDIDAEIKLGDTNFLEGAFNTEGLFTYTCEEWVLERMPFQEKCEIRKGYFPDTAKGLETEKFCFVNLDMDLYVPQLEGLRFFYDRMVEGGVILLHDYFHPQLPGVKRAVNDFIKERNENITILTIGDGCSIAIIK